MVCYSTNLVLFIAIPVPVINVTAIGTGAIGENYSVLCSVDVDDSLYNIVVNTTIVKVGESVVVNSSVSTGDNSVSIPYTSLMTSHSGQYQCLVDISQIDINYQESYVKIFTINTTSKFTYTDLNCPCVVIIVMLYQT